MKLKLTAILFGALLSLAACGDGGAASADANNAAASAAPYGESAIGCKRLFLGGTPPVFADQRMAEKSTPVCNRAFASLYSDVVRNPLWAAEYLTKEAVAAGQAVTRIDNFAEDDRLPKGRPNLADYRGSGWDRGHLAPDANMPSRAAANEAFALGVNIAPQFPKTNRGRWADLEGAVRRQTRGGPVYLVTGTLYEGRVTATKPDGRVKVPTHFWKAMVAKDQQGVTRGATVFVVTNGPEERWANMTVDQFAKVHRVDPFPSLEPVYRTANGAKDGSLNRALEVGANAADQNGSGSGAGANSEPSEGRMVRSPLSGQYMLESDFRKQYKRAPKPEEY